MGYLDGLTNGRVNLHGSEPKGRARSIDLQRPLPHPQNAAELLSSSLPATTGLSAHDELRRATQSGSPLATGAAPGKPQAPGTDVFLFAQLRRLNPQTSPPRAQLRPPGGRRSVDPGRRSFDTSAGPLSPTSSQSSRAETSSPSGSPSSASSLADAAELPFPIDDVKPSP